MAICADASEDARLEISIYCQRSEVLNADASVIIRGRDQVATDGRCILILPPSVPCVDVAGNVDRSGLIRSIILHVEIADLKISCHVQAAAVVNINVSL